MAWVNGEDQGTSSVGRSLARHKMKHPQQQEEHGGGKEVTISEKPGGGYHTHSKMNAGEEGQHAEHPTIEHAMEHAKGHFGHSAEKKEPHEQMPEQQAESKMGGSGGLEDMGIAAA